MGIAVGVIDTEGGAVAKTGDGEVNNNGGIVMVGMEPGWRENKLHAMINIANIFINNQKRFIVDIL